MAIILEGAVSNRQDKRRRLVGKFEMLARSLNHNGSGHDCNPAPAAAKFVATIMFSPSRNWGLEDQSGSDTGMSDHRIQVPI